MSITTLCRAGMHHEYARAMRPAKASLPLSPARFAVRIDASPLMFG